MVVEDSSPDGTLAVAEMLQVTPIFLFFFFSVQSERKRNGFLCVNSINDNNDRRQYVVLYVCLTHQPGLLLSWYRISLVAPAFPSRHGVLTFPLQFGK